MPDPSVDPPFPNEEKCGRRSTHVTVSTRGESNRPQFQVLMPLQPQSLCGQQMSTDYSLPLPLTVHLAMQTDSIDRLTDLLTY
jgi:hypothetical protein